MRDFSSYKTAGYFGSLAPQSSAQYLAQPRDPRSIIAVIRWSDYITKLGGQPNIGVVLNFANGNVQSLDCIRSVYVDNSASSNIITLVFPDTGFTVAAQPNSVCVYPVYSNSNVCNVYATGLVSASLPITRMVFFNYVAGAYADLEIIKASNLALSSNNGYISNPAGDTFETAKISVNAGGALNTPITMITNPNAIANYLYIKNIKAIIYGIVNDTGGTGGEIEWSVKFATGGTLLKFSHWYGKTAGAPYLWSQTVLDQNMIYPFLTQGNSISMVATQAALPGNNAGSTFNMQIITTWSSTNLLI